MFYFEIKYSETALHFSQEGKWNFGIRAVKQKHIYFLL